MSHKQDSGITRVNIIGFAILISKILHLKKKSVDYLCITNLEHSTTSKLCCCFFLVSTNLIEALNWHYLPVAESTFCT